MAELATGTNVDSLLLRARYPPSAVQGHELISEMHRVVEDRQVQMYVEHRERPSALSNLLDVSRTVLGLHELVRLASEIPDDLAAIPGDVSDEGREFLAARARRRRDLSPRYTVRAVEMHSPLSVVLEIPPAAVAAFGFALLALAERVATAQTRVSKKRARNLRDKAGYDRERVLIETGRLDMAYRLMCEHPRPDVVEIVGGDEDFEAAEAIEPAQLDRSIEGRGDS